MSNVTKENATKYNWDNNFSTRFKVNDGTKLSYIPDNIFMIEIPEISLSDMSGNNEEKRTLNITLRSTKDGNVEKEVYDILMRKSFDIDVSLSNPNNVDYSFLNCIVSKMQFAPLIHKPKANPYNFTIKIEANVIKYHNANGDLTIGDEVFVIDDSAKQMEVIE